MRGIGIMQNPVLFLKLISDCLLGCNFMCNLEFIVKIAWSDHKAFHLSFKSYSKYLLQATDVTSIYLSSFFVVINFGFHPAFNYVNILSPEAYPIWKVITHVTSYSRPLSIFFEHDRSGLHNYYITCHIHWHTLSSSSLVVKMPLIVIAYFGSPLFQDTDSTQIFLIYFVSFMRCTIFHTFFIIHPSTTMIQSIFILCKIPSFLPMFSSPPLYCVM
jgi:hypothetical protein